jgi:hypothetical protein
MYRARAWIRLVGSANAFFTEATVFDPRNPCKGRRADQRAYAAFAITVIACAICVLT